MIKNKQKITLFLVVFSCFKVLPACFFPWNAIVEKYMRVALFSTCLVRNFPPLGKWVATSEFGKSRRG